MKKLKNWDNKTWLSSKSYISQFNRFLKNRTKRVQVNMICKNLNKNIGN